MSPILIEKSRINTAPKSESPRRSADVARKGRRALVGPLTHADRRMSFTRRFREQFGSGTQACIRPNLSQAVWSCAQTKCPKTRVLSDEPFEFKLLRAKLSTSTSRSPIQTLKTLSLSHGPSFFLKTNPLKCNPSTWSVQDSQAAKTNKSCTFARVKRGSLLYFPITSYT